MKLNQFEADAMKPTLCSLLDKEDNYVQRGVRLSTLFERFQNEWCNLADYSAAVLLSSS